MATWKQALQATEKTPAAVPATTAAIAGIEDAANVDRIPAIATRSTLQPIREPVAYLQTATTQARATVATRWATAKGEETGKVLTETTQTEMRVRIATLDGLCFAMK